MSTSITGINIFEENDIGISADTSRELTLNGCYFEVNNTAGIDVQSVTLIGCYQNQPTGGDKFLISGDKHIYGSTFEWQAIDGEFNSGLSMDFSEDFFTYQSINPTLVLKETDQVGGDGLFRIRGSGDTLSIRHNTAVAGDFSTETKIIEFDNGTSAVEINGLLDMGTNKISNVVDPTADQDAATKKYVDDNAGGGGITAGDSIDLSGITDGTKALTFTSDTAWDSTDTYGTSAFVIENTANTHNQPMMIIRTATNSTSLGNSPHLILENQNGGAAQIEFIAQNANEASSEVAAIKNTGKIEMGVAPANSTTHTGAYLYINDRNAANTGFTNDLLRLYERDSTYNGIARFFGAGIIQDPAYDTNGDTLDADVFHTIKSPAGRKSFVRLENSDDEKWEIQHATGGNLEFFYEGTNVARVWQEGWLGAYGNDGNSGRIYLGSGRYLGYDGTRFIVNGADLNLTSQKIVNLATPISGTDGANKNYVDTEIAALSTSGGFDITNTNDADTVHLLTAPSTRKTLFRMTNGDGKNWTFQHSLSNEFDFYYDGSLKTRFTKEGWFNSYGTSGTNGRIYFGGSKWVGGNDNGIVVVGGNLDMNTQKIVGLVDPTADQEAATKKYVDDEISGVSGGSVGPYPIIQWSGTVTKNDTTTTDAVLDADLGMYSGNMNTEKDVSVDAYDMSSTRTIPAAGRLTKMRVVWDSYSGDVKFCLHKLTRTNESNTVVATELFASAALTPNATRIDTFTFTDPDYAVSAGDEIFISFRRVNGSGTVYSKIRDWSVFFEAD